MTVHAFNNGNVVDRLIRFVNRDGDLQGTPTQSTGSVGSRKLFLAKPVSSLPACNASGTPGSGNVVLHSWNTTTGSLEPRRHISDSSGTEGNLATRLCWNFLPVSFGSEKTLIVGEVTEGTLIVLREIMPAGDVTLTENFLPGDTAETDNAEITINGNRYGQSIPEGTLVTVEPSGGGYRAVDYIIPDLLGKVTDTITESGNYTIGLLPQGTQWNGNLTLTCRIALPENTQIISQSEGYCKWIGNEWVFVPFAWRVRTREPQYAQASGNIDRWGFCTEATVTVPGYTPAMESDWPSCGNPLVGVTSHVWGTTGSFNTIGIYRTTDEVITGSTKWAKSLTACTFPGVLGSYWVNTSSYWEAEPNLAVCLGGVACADYTAHPSEYGINYGVVVNNHLTYGSGTDIIWYDGSNWIRSASANRDLTETFDPTDPNICTSDPYWDVTVNGTTITFSARGSAWSPRTGIQPTETDTLVWDKYLLDDDYPSSDIYGRYKPVDISGNTRAGSSFYFGDPVLTVGNANPSNDNRFIPRTNTIWGGISGSDWNGTYRLTDNANHSVSWSNIRRSSEVTTLGERLNAITGWFESTSEQTVSSPVTYTRIAPDMPLCRLSFQNIVTLNQAEWAPASTPTTWGSACYAEYPNGRINLAPASPTSNGEHLSITLSGGKYQSATDGGSFVFHWQVPHKGNIQFNPGELASQGRYTQQQPDGTTTSYLGIPGFLECDLTTDGEYVEVYNAGEPYLWWTLNTTPDLEVTFTEQFPVEGNRSLSWADLIDEVQASIYVNRQTGKAKWFPTSDTDVISWWQCDVTDLETPATFSFHKNIGSEIPDRADLELKMTDFLNGLRYPISTCEECGTQIYWTLQRHGDDFVLGEVGSNDGWFVCEDPTVITQVITFAYVTPTPRTFSFDWKAYVLANRSGWVYASDGSHIELGSLQKHTSNAWYFGTWGSTSGWFACSDPAMDVAYTATYQFDTTRHALITNTVADYVAAGRRLALNGTTIGTLQEVGSRLICGTLNDPLGWYELTGDLDSNGWMIAENQVEEWERYREPVSLSWARTFTGDLPASITVNFKVYDGCHSAKMLVVGG